jgi:hypothetical protein
MNLSDISPTVSPTRMNRIIESRFGFSIDYNRLTVNKATKLNNSITENINRIRNSFGSHTAERNPKYMELLVVREALHKWITARRKLTEGEIGKSEAILASKDVVNSIQDMLEKLSKIQAEQVPALVDTIRDQIGNEQADQYKTNVSELLSNLTTQLSQAREQADNATRALTGEAPAGEMQMATGAPEQGGQHAEQPAQSADTFAASDAAAGGTQPLGRAVR